MTYVFAGIPLFRHFLFFCRLREAGLLTLSRLVEAGPIRWRRTYFGCLVTSCSTTLMATRSIGFSFRMHGRLRMGTRTYRPTATYRGLCDGCMKTHGNAILAGCPLLLQLWSYERLAVGRPIVSHEPYHEAMYDDEEDDRPTMGTLWNWRQVRSQQI